MAPTSATPPDPASRTVLAIIDMQNVFGDPDSPWLAPRFAEVVPPVRRLAEAYGDRTVFTRFISPEQPRGAWQAYYAQWPFALQPADAALWDVVPALAPLVTDRRVDAPTFSKWPGLSDLVGPDDRLVLCGVSTDCCVLSTALAAADAGREVVVVADACTGVDDASHAAALDVMRLYGPLVRVVDLDDALDLAPGASAPLSPGSTASTDASETAAGPPEAT